MRLPKNTDTPPLRETEGGIIRIANTRIPLERVLRAFLAGSTPEQIVQDFDVLKIEDVYSAINYYLHHRSDVDTYLAESDSERVNVRNNVEQLCDPTGVRARLLARRPAESS